MRRKLRVKGMTEEDRQLIQKVPVDKLLEKLGVDVVQWRARAGYIACCPFHPDNSPSFAIQNEGDKKGLWNCFHDRDNFKGDMFDFVARMRDVDKAEARSLLMGWFSIDGTLAPDVTELKRRLSAQSDPEPYHLPRVPLPRTGDDVEPIIHYLMNDPSRKLMGYTRDDSLQIIKRWNLRYARSGYYTNRIIIPMCNVKGDQIFYQAQAISKEAVAHLPGYQSKIKLYPSKAPVPLHLHNLHDIEGDYVIVVEGFWDMVALDHWGFPVVMSGSAYLTPEQLDLLVEHVRRVWIWYDNDSDNPNNPGLKNAETAADKLFSNEIQAWVVEGPKGDPDEVGSRKKARRILRTMSHRLVSNLVPTIEDLENEILG